MCARGRVRFPELDLSETRGQHRAIRRSLAVALVCVCVCALAGSCAGRVANPAPARGAAAGEGDRALDPAVSPGGNFDLSRWELQEPVGEPRAPRIVKPAALVGPHGYRDPYFFTDPTDGAMTFWDPENGVSTLHSNYPRSELREMNADGTEANWPVAGTNRLAATVAVTRVPERVCVGQIHVGAPLGAGLPPSTKPLLELYAYATGRIAVGIERDPSGGQTLHDLARVPIGARFRYTIELSGDGTIALTLDGARTTFVMPPAFAGYGQYFKAGAYDQTAGGDASVGATVKFYALSVSH
jgi:hypothetical protein